MKKQFNSQTDQLTKDLFVDKLTYFVNIIQNKHSTISHLNKRFTAIPHRPRILTSLLSPLGIARKTALSKCPERFCCGATKYEFPLLCVDYFLFARCDNANLFFTM